MQQNHFGGKKNAVRVLLPVRPMSESSMDDVYERRVELVLRTVTNYFCFTFVRQFLFVEKNAM